MTYKKQMVALAVAAGLLLGASTALAQATTVACNDTSVLPNPVFMAGSSAFEPILSQLAVQIAAKQGVSIIYDPISSCLGVSAVSPPADNPAPQPLTGTAHYYTVDPTNPSNTVTNSCNLSGNTMATIGISDVAFFSCQNIDRPANIGEWDGPEQSMLIVVPKANYTTTAISSQQAAAIWGCGAKSGVGNFTNETAIQQRSATSGTQILIARNIGVPESAFKGAPNGSSSAMVTSLLAVPDPQTAIGFVAADFYANQRAKLNAVAFRGIGQTKAYYADSSATATDLKNVRDGHYMIQGPLHFFSPLTAGQPAPNAQLVLNWLTGAVPIDPANPNSYVSTVAVGGDVPQCAMKVKIDKDGGSFSPYHPPVSCTCAFEAAKSVQSVAGTCTTHCTSDAACTGGTHCQTGYCE
jgi:ABC-type phosphate transport system substrate-binding protein